MRKPKPWSGREVRYLEEHAHEGAVEVSKALGRSPKAVRMQASHYGLSLRKRWHCPRCGMWVHKPLSGTTGWCAACTKERRADLKETEVEEYVREVERELEQDRRIQAAYARKSRAKRKRKQ